MFVPDIMIEYDKTRNHLEGKLIKPSSEKFKFECIRRYNRCFIEERPPFKIHFMILFLLKLEHKAKLILL